LKYLTPLPPMLTLRDGADLEMEKAQNIIGIYGEVANSPT